MISFTQRVQNISATTAIGVTNPNKTVRPLSFESTKPPIFKSPETPNEPDGSSVIGDPDFQVSVMLAPESVGDQFQFSNEGFVLGNSFDFGMMTIFIDSVPRAAVTYTLDREGTPFMYVSTDHIHKGVFTNGDVFFNS
jgi:hypothetical protein